MPRIRSIKPTFWTDEKLGLMPRDVRLTFLGLISALADDHGRLSGNSRIIRGAIYPYDDDVTATDVERHLSVLADAGRIVRYNVNGDEYVAIRNWLLHQKVDKPSKSLLPAPPRTLHDDSTNGRRTLPNERSGAERSGDGYGRDKERSGGDSSNGSRVSEEIESDPSPLRIEPEDRAAEPPLSAPLVVLPVEAERLVEQLYSLATEKRQLDVRRQLYDTLDPRGRGARLRRGVFVRARDPAHLAACCRAVMQDPPRAIDAAIVVVLEKLQDPPPGPSPAEQRATDEKARLDREEVEGRERKRLAIRWAHEHPDEYETLRAEVAQSYAHLPENAFTKKAIEAELTSKCAERADQNSGRISEVAR